VTSGFDDAELEADLVGVASARLLAAGVPRLERLQALQLLGVLVNVADARRRVRRPLAELAVEFDLPADEVDGWLGHLRGVGAVRWEGGQYVLGAVEPPAAGGIRLQDFLSLVAEVDAPAAIPPRRRAPLLRPAGAVLAAAAVLLLAVIGPGVVRDRSTPVSSTRDEAPETATTVAPSLRALGPAATTSTARPSTTAVPAPPAKAVPGGEQLGPVLVSTTTTLQLACPGDLPVITVLGSRTDPDGHLVVDGLARNRSPEEVVIHGFTLSATVGGEDVSGPGTEHDLAVPGFGTVLWRTTLPIVAPPGTTVRAALGDWVWERAAVASTCPSP
jgi:hypothetical protein